jgi:hypothetical protein
LNTAAQPQYDDPGATGAFLARAEAYLARAEALRAEMERLVRHIERNPAALRAARELIVAGVGLGRNTTAIEELSAAAACKDIIGQRGAAPQPPPEPAALRLRLVAR